jgi:cytochrome c-type biogenesis protein CcmH/NrfF
MRRKMYRFRNSLLVLFVAAAALAQTASQKPSVDVRRVGARLRCQCGCPDSVATCIMLECHFGKPSKERIAQMQSVGMSDEQIVQAFIRDYGMAIYLAPPNAVGWIVPYALTGLGMVLIVLFLRRNSFKAKPPLTDLGTIGTEDPELAKYKDQIEKDTANLD